MCDFSATRHEGGDVSLDGQVVVQKDTFRYLGSVPQKLKGKFYRTAIRQAMLYGAECWPTKRQHVQQLSVAEMAYVVLVLWAHKMG